MIVKEETTVAIGIIVLVAVLVAAFLVTGAILLTMFTLPSNKQGGVPSIGDQPYDISAPVTNSK